MPSPALGAAARGGGILHLERLLEGQLDVEAAVLDSIAASAPLSTRLMAVSTATQAAALYLSAAAMPRSATRLALSQDGLIIDGPMAMPPGHLSKSQFLFAFQSVASGRLVPRVIKLFRHQISLTASLACGATWVMRRQARSSPLYLLRRSGFLECHPELQGCLRRVGF